MINKWRNLLLLFSVWLIVASCTINDEDNTPTPTPIVSKPTKEYDVSLAVKWADMTLSLVRKTAGFSPPVASRAISYAGITMYEAGVHGMPEYRSLAGQLNALSTLPQPTANQKYNWGLVINAAEHSILKELFVTTSEANKARVDSLKNSLENELIATNSEASDVVTRSNEYGVALAKAIWEYSKTDGGHEGYKRNFPATYVVPKGVGFWEPTENGQKIPMQPTWGTNRTFVATNASIALPIPKTISYNANSDYFKEYLAVYQKNKSLTQEEKEISIWWADDPSETFTPPGHSYSIAKIAIKTANSKLDQALEAFAKTGISVADAFICCWKVKFTYNNIRPYTYVRKAIDPDWIPFWPAPPFPGFSSGHATQSAASATVLESVYGKNFAFTDNTWEGRAKDTKRNTEFKPRKLSSFWVAAQESALSRFLGGIHTAMDNNAGLEQGKKIGENVLTIQFKK